MDSSELENFFETEYKYILDILLIKIQNELPKRPIDLIETLSFFINYDDFFCKKLKIMFKENQ